MSLHSQAEQPARFDRVIQSWDTASKAKELADHSVCTTWGIKKDDNKSDHYYLLHVFRKQVNYPELRRAVHEQARTHIEDSSSGTQLIQEFTAEGLPGVTKYTQDGDKAMRMLHAQTATIENGFVHLPRDAHWLEEYLHELTAFPHGKHDDQADSTSQALDWMKRNSGATGEDKLRYLSWLATGKPMQPKPDKERMRAPAGKENGRYYIDGRTVIPDENGEAEFREEVARIEERHGWTRVSD